MISKLKINGSEHDIHAKIADTATKATQDDQGNNINDTYVKKTQSAGSALGLVKTGGDVSISSGVITVKDDSHNHIISNIDGLQQLLDNKADTFYIEGSGTTDATAKTSTWIGSHDGITSYYDGLTLRYKIGVAGQSTVTLNINNLGAKTVYRFDDTKLTTHFPVNSIIQLIYHEDLNGGCWITNDYDANTNTQQRVYESSAKNIEYPITARYSTTTGKDYYAEYGRYSNSVTLNPSTNTITATTFKGDLDGNASTATKATQDGSGNVITSTYTKKTIYDAHEHSATYTPEGTVSQPTFTGSAVTSGKPDTTNVTTIYSITGVGTLPSATLSSGTLPSASLEKGTFPSLTFSTGDLPTLTASVENQCLTLSFGQGSLPSAILNQGSLPSLTFNAGAFPTLTFNAGSLPTRSNAISMPNTNHTHSVTASGSVSQPTFTGTQATITTGTPE